MNAYRTGWLLVVGTVLVSLAVCTAFAARGGSTPPPPAAEDLSAAGYGLGDYKLTERSGKAVTQADLANDVWIAAFIFTRCPASCPRISAQLKSILNEVGPGGVKGVSISVDPEYDTPEVLAKYAQGLGADPNGWWFLTGARDDVYKLILDKFKLSVAPNTAADQKEGAEAVAHSDRLVLVDRNNQVLGAFVSSDAEAMKRLIGLAKEKGSAGAWYRKLPALNASLNGTCAVLLVLGWVLIRKGAWKAHAICMSAGVVVSALFLGCYLVYHYFAGSVAFRGQGPIRVAYFAILLSHTLLATFGVVPLVSLTLYRTFRKQWDLHAKVARLTFPIWLYVSVTGVVIYLMLYQMPV